MFKRRLLLERKNTMLPRRQLDIIFQMPAATASGKSAVPGLSVNNQVPG